MRWDVHRGGDQVDGEGWFFAHEMLIDDIRGIADLASLTSGNRDI